MSIVFRPARADDLQRAQELVVRSINDLTERHGFGRMASVRRPDFQLFCLNDDPDGLWLAEDGQEIVGSAFSWACGDLWFLAELFVAPDQQGNGVGNQLLRRSFDHANKAGATNKSLITFTFNVVSQGLYIRHGMLPRLPLYLCSGSSSRVEAKPGDRLHHTPVEYSHSHLQNLARLDVSALGVSREKHHRYLLNDASIIGFLLGDEGNYIGYAYVSTSGHVGPLAVADARYTGPAFRTALDLAAATGASQLSAFVPGVSEATSIALQYGMRISFPMVLVSTHEFGDWARYLPRNPGFM